jgi:hypothetical protein
MKDVLRIVSITLLIVTIGVVFFTGCSEASRVSSNISREADNFNVIRELTVINDFSDTVVFQMGGNFSITEDGDQLVISK